jgi:hypothetical protein
MTVNPVGFQSQMSQPWPVEGPVFLTLAPPFPAVAPNNRSMCGPATYLFVKASVGQSRRLTVRRPTAMIAPAIANTKRNLTHLV